MYCNGKLLFLLIGILLCSTPGCSSFSSLTNISDSPTGRPAASTCGSCHNAQFNEWSLSRHSVSYTNAVFQKEYREAGDTDCLACHAPLGVRMEKAGARSSHLHEGVDCISCHYSEGKMHGPHSSSALFQPHPMAKKDRLYFETTLCASCHEETADEYGETTRTKALPTCLQCHATPVQRTVSQGTGFFSRLLVSFEDQVSTSSHTISLDALHSQQGEFLSLSEGITKDPGQILLKITNPLPHNLPTGTFGQKSVQLQIEFSRGDATIAEETLSVADETAPLLPGGVKQLLYSMPAIVQQGDRMQIVLKRFAAPDASRPAVALAQKGRALTGSDFQ